MARLERELAKDPPHPAPQAPSSESEGPVSEAATTAPEEEHEVVRAALRDLFRGVRARPLALHPVAVPLVLFEGRVLELAEREPWTEGLPLPAQAAALEAERCGAVAWLHPESEGSRDWYELYRSHPDVQGLATVSRVSWSPDRRCALLHVRNEIGFGSRHRRAVRARPLPEGPWSETVGALLILEREKGLWTVRRHVDLSSAIPDRLLARVKEEEFSRALREGPAPPGVASVLVRKVEFEQRHINHFWSPGACELGLLLPDGALRVVRVATEGWVDEQIMRPPPLSEQGTTWSTISAHEPDRYYLPDVPLAVVDRLSSDCLLEAAARLAKRVL